MRGMLLQHLGRHGLAVQPLLQVVERRHGLLAAHQQLAVEHALEVDRLDDVGKGAGDVLAGAAVEPLHAARGGDLHADAVPFPFGAEVRRIERVELGAVDRIGQHRRQEGAAGIAAAAAARPAAASRTAAGRAATRPCQISSTASTGWLPMLATACLASRAETPTRSAPVSSFSSAQRPVESSASSQRFRIAGVCGLVARCSVSTTSPRRRRRPGGGIGLPDQRQRLGEIADIVVGEGEQLGADLVLRRSRAAARAWRRESRGRRSAPPAPSRDRDRASARR